RCIVGRPGYSSLPTRRNRPPKPTSSSASIGSISAGRCARPAAGKGLPRPGFPAPPMQTTTKGGGWAMSGGAPPAVWVLVRPVLAPRDRFVRLLLDTIKMGSQSAWPQRKAAPPAGTPSGGVGPLSVDALARITTATLAPHNPSYIRLPLGWSGDYCRFGHPLD